MVTKITVQLPNAYTYHPAPDPSKQKEYGRHEIQDAAEELHSLSKHLRQIAVICNDLVSTPSVSVQTVISANTGKVATVREYTKRKRTYSIAYLTIWEEDEVKG